MFLHYVYKTLMRHHIVNKCIQIVFRCPPKHTFGLAGISQQKPNLAGTEVLFTNLYTNCSCLIFSLM